MVEKLAENVRIQAWFSVARNCFRMGRGDFCSIIWKGVDNLKGAMQR
jgi:hypothetical protein